VLETEHARALLVFEKTILVINGLESFVVVEVAALGLNWCLGGHHVAVLESFVENVGFGVAKRRKG